jgi:hypothetical protein
MPRAPRVDPPRNPYGIGVPWQHRRPKGEAHGCPGEQIAWYNQNSPLRVRQARCFRGSPRHRLTLVVPWMYIHKRDMHPQVELNGIHGRGGGSHGGHIFGDDYRQVVR